MTRSALAAFALVFAGALAGCGESEDAARIPADDQSDLEGIVREIAGAIAERDAETVLRHIALDFRGGPSDREPDLDHADAQAIVLEFLHREHLISARLEHVRVGETTSDGSRRVEARIWFDASDVLRDPASAIPASAVRYSFDLRFARREGTWQALEARYARMGRAG